MWRVWVGDARLDCASSGVVALSGGASAASAVASGPLLRVAASLECAPDWRLGLRGQRPQCPVVGVAASLECAGGGFVPCPGWRLGLRGQRLQCPVVGVAGALSAPAGFVPCPCCASAYAGSGSAPCQLCASLDGAGSGLVGAVCGGASGTPGGLQGPVFVACSSRWQRLQCSVLLLAVARRPVSPTDHVLIVVRSFNHVHGFESMISNQSLKFTGALGVVVWRGGSVRVVGVCVGGVRVRRSRSAEAKFSVCCPLAAVRRILRLRCRWESPRSSPRWRR